MSTAKTYIEQGRLLLTWRHAAAVSVVGNVSFGPNPPTTAVVPVMPGLQSWIHLCANWATGARAAPDLQKLILTPQYANVFGTGSTKPAANGMADNANNLAVMTPDGATRIFTGDITLPATLGVTSPGHVMRYRPRTIVPTSTGVATRIVATELVQDRIEWFRDDDPGTAYGQYDQFPYMVAGTPPVAFLRGRATALYSLSFAIGWVGTNGVENTEPPPFVDGDSLSIIYMQGHE